MGFSCYLCKRKRQRGNITLHQFPKNLAILEAWANFCKLNTSTDNFKNLRLCCSHFTNNDFKTNDGQMTKRYLKDDAVPSIYDSSKKSRVIMLKDNAENACNDENVDAKSIVQNVAEESKKEKLIVQNVAEESKKEKPIVQNVAEECEREELIGQNVAEECEREFVDENDCSVLKKCRPWYEPRYVNDVEVKDFATPKRASRTLKMIKERHKEKCQRLHYLQKTCNRLRKKVLTLEDLLRDIKRKG